MSATSREAVEAAWAAFATRDPATIAACFTEDAEWVAPEGNATALALNGPSHMVGSDAIARFIGQDFGALFVDNVAIDFRGFHVAGDVVVVEETMRATLAHGGEYENDYCFVFRVRDGKIAQVREYMDTLKGRRLIFPDGVEKASAMPR